MISKEHYVNLEEISENDLSILIRTVKKIGQALKKGLGVEGYNVQVNNDPIAGQIIPHIHFHVIPRTRDDGLSLWPQGKYEEGEAVGVVKKIKKVLA